VLCAALVFSMAAASADAFYAERTNTGGVAVFVSRSDMVRGGTYVACEILTRSYARPLAVLCSRVASAAARLVAANAGVWIEVDRTGLHYGTW
jgi:archaellum component FlaF (FlaF/FlaG flagellin family)